MNENAVLKCGGCGANLQFSGEDKTSILCEFCNSTTVVESDPYEASEPPPPSREVLIEKLQLLHKIAGAMVTAVFAIFFVKIFGTPVGIVASIVYCGLDFALVTPDSRVGKTRMAPAESLLIWALGSHWKPRLVATELGTCTYCGLENAERGGACMKSPNKTHLVLEITKAGSIDLASLESVPLPQDRSIWLIAVTIGFCWAFSK
jgi:hypothetical protein